MFSIQQKPLIIDDGPFRFDKNIQLFVRRLDAIDPVYGGNKFYKLKYNLLRAQKEGINNLVSFGGAYSNHIAALARVGSLCGMHTFGIIRGEKSSIKNNTLKRAADDGMKLIFCNRTDYRNKLEPDFLNQFAELPEKYFVIPEGGANAEGIQGASEILHENDKRFDVIAVSCGTGTTAAGLIMKIKPHQKLIGFSVLRDWGSIEDEIIKNLKSLQYDLNLTNWHINHDFHFGGYGKTTPELNSFIGQFNNSNSINLEPVYTGKMFFGLNKLILDGYFQPETKIMAIHTGGLQYLV